MSKSLSPQISTADCTLLLVRHAHTEMAGRFCGQIDPPLSAEGLGQLPKLVERLGKYPVTHIFSSDLQRARQTAEPIAQRCQLPIHQVAFLREFAFGSWEGLKWDQIAAQDPQYAQRWLDLYPSVPAPGGELFADFRKRIHEAMDAIAAQMQAGCAVVVTHGGVIRTFLADAAGHNASPADFSQCEYASFCAVRREEGKWRLADEIAAAPACRVTCDGR